MSQNITLHTVRKEAINVIEQLRTKQIDYKTAAEIRNLLNVIIDTAKVQIEFVKVLPSALKDNMSQQDIKKMVCVMNDKDAEIDETLAKLKAENPINEPERPDACRIIT